MTSRRIAHAADRSGSKKTTIRVDFWVVAGCLSGFRVGNGWKIKSQMKYVSFVWDVIQKFDLIEGFYFG